MQRERVIKNPVLRGFNPDPSILRVGDDYYIATSTFEWFPGVRIHHSRDLIHWRLLTHALTRTSQIDLLGDPASGGVWAPCLSHDGRLFHLAFTDVKSRGAGFVDAHNYLTTAPDIAGPWSDPTYLNSSGFDPSLFHDDDGRKWLVNMIWDHRSGKKSGGIVLQEYDPAGKTLAGRPVLIFRGTLYGMTEGPHLYKRNGFYYLVTAEGGTGFDHMVTVARSRTLAGPYEVDPRNPILTSRSNPALPLQKAGHASLVATQDGSWYLAHLCGRPLPGTRLCHLGRETAIQKCHWTADGWLRLSGGGNEPALEVEAPDLPACPWPAEPGRDDCDAPTLGPEFNTLRSPPAADWLSLTERPGYLRLRGRESLTSCFRVSLVARRLQSFQCEATMRLEFSPETFQQSAGLVCIYDHRHFLFLRVSHDESAGRNVAVLAEDQGRLSPSDEVPIDAAAPCYLRVRFDDRAVQFFHSADAGTWRPIGPQYDAGKLSDDYCQGFTGTFIGLAATDSSGRSIRADFDFFEYREQEEA